MSKPSVTHVFIPGKVLEVISDRDDDGNVTQAEFVTYLEHERTQLTGDEAAKVVAALCPTPPARPSRKK